MRFIYRLYLRDLYSFKSLITCYAQYLLYFHCISLSFSLFLWSLRTTFLQCHVKTCFSFDKRRQKPVAPQQCCYGDVSKEIDGKICAVKMYCALNGNVGPHGLRAYAVSVLGARSVDAVDGAQCEWFYTCYVKPVWCELLSPGGISFHFTRV